MRRIILASASPRRKELLASLGISFIVDPSSLEEDLTSKKSPSTLVRKLSLDKAKEVSRRHKNAIIIAADTVVAIDGKVLGKPKDSKEAKKMLRMLSGKTHSVITGITIIDTSTSKTESKSVESKVTFRKITDEEIDAYIQTDEPLDKAGAYGIQGKGGALIEKTIGDYANIVGLPLVAVAKVLKKLDPTLLPF